jgi:hypothetical protein
MKNLNLKPIYYKIDAYKIRKKLFEKERRKVI